MTTWQLLTTTWTWEPSVLLGCLALLVGYVALARPLTARATFFVAGDAVLLLALLSPLDTLGDAYLFSAHMLQHLLLVLVAPPLLLVGIPPRLFERFLQWPPARRVERVLGQPLLAWVIGMGTLWVWHLPALYDAALHSEGLHTFQHLTFLVTATIFWWPLVAPAPLRRLPALAGVPYLLAASFSSSVLGIILTFAPVGFYPFYLHPADPLGILRLVREGWGLSLRADQQLGGLLMWMLSTPVYLAILTVVFARWYGEPETDLPDADLVEVEAMDEAAAPAMEYRGASSGCSRRLAVMRLRPRARQEG